MIIAGKCPPEKEELKDARERGFDNVELYLEKEHLDDFEKILENCQNSELEIVSLHTPHVNIEEETYFLKSDKLAQKLDAKLVLHSKRILHTATNEVENIGFDSELFFENQPGSSVRHLKQIILDQERNLALDVAHFYMAEENYVQKTGEFLQKYTDQIGVIHLCDSSTTQDGLGFGKGVMDMEKVCQAVDDSAFDGILVLEVMPDEQEDALEKWKSYT